MNTRRALAFIFCTVALDVLALGVMIPVLPTIVLGFMDGDTAGAAEMFGVFATVWALMQFLCSPLLGALSDRYGRRPVILISCLGLGLDYIFMALAPSLLLLLVGRVVSGITSATIGTSFAYIADVTKPQERARAFGLVGMAFGLGFVVGPAIGGLLGSVDPRLPFWVSAAACLANAAFGWFVLPESLPPEKRMAFSWRRANPIGSLKLLASHRQLLGLAAVDFLGNFAHQVLPAVFVLYAGHRYGWGKATVGLTLAFVGVCTAVVQGLMIGPIVSRLGARRAVVAGLLAGAAGMSIYGLASTGPWFWAGVPVMAFWGIAGPALQEMMTRRVSGSEQGQLQGATSASRSIAGLIAPGLFAVLFAWTIDSVPGAAFLLAGGLLAAAAVVTWLVTARTRPAAPAP
ncbi:MAG: MFS transporter [Reyranella sp.]|uniref:TCR/Tet family MFS transporter n=1 Tax=Reyranella sp. TaxID=1929291 RepID=UPI001210171A|nr:TCR/Tet family MFS transporter [Reyranella sp.]TAJ95028.1 MAG: MFS transporter [Reyranella sp.]